MEPIKDQNVKEAYIHGSSNTKQSLKINTIKSQEMYI